MGPGAGLNNFGAWIDTKKLCPTFWPTAAFPTRDSRPI